MNILPDGIEAVSLHLCQPVTFCEQPTICVRTYRTDQFLPHNCESTIADQSHACAWHAMLAIVAKMVEISIRDRHNGGSIRYQMMRSSMRRTTTYSGMIGRDIAIAIVPQYLAHTQREHVCDMPKYCRCHRTTAGSKTSSARHAGPSNGINTANVFGVVDAALLAN